MKFFFNLLFFCFIIGCTTSKEQIESLNLFGPYLGQTPPGKTPKIFAPGIISVDENFEHSAAIFSPDNTEVYWTTNVGMYTENRVIGNLRLYYMKMINGHWTAPQIPSFAKELRLDRPVFSPDGNRLYFEMQKSYYDPAGGENIDIFFVERTENGWSDPVPVSQLINTNRIERLHCITADGSLYFSRDPFSNEEIFVSKYIDGEFVEPEKLEDGFDSEVIESVIILSPDKKFMLIGQFEHPGTDEVHISYQKTDGTWTERIKTPFWCGGFMALSPDGKYLFMLNEGISWVNTSFVEELKPKDLI